MSLMFFALIFSINITRLWIKLPYGRCDSIRLSKRSSGSHRNLWLVLWHVGYHLTFPFCKWSLKNWAVLSLWNHTLFMLSVFSSLFHNGFWPAHILGLQSNQPRHLCWRLPRWCGRPACSRAWHIPGNSRTHARHRVSLVVCLCDKSGVQRRILPSDSCSKNCVARGNTWKGHSCNTQECVCIHTVWEKCVCQQAESYNQKVNVDIMQLT